MIAREGHALPVGYGSMLLESFVGDHGDDRGLRAAARRLLRGQLAGGRRRRDAGRRGRDDHGLGLSGDGRTRCSSWPSRSARQSLFYRTGGAPSLALGMAHIFCERRRRRRLLGFWYHFAIMFEALFILTIIDAGTRVGRFMLQDLLGHVYKPLGRTSWMPGVIGTSAADRAGLGLLPDQGVLDPLGGINSLWPLFGIANQLLAAIALSVATTILLKMHGARYMWVTLRAAGLAGHRDLHRRASRRSSRHCRASASSRRPTSSNGDRRRARSRRGRVAETQTLIFNARLDAVVCGIFLVLVTTILVDSIRLWIGILRGTRPAQIRETSFVPTQLGPEESW